jgi:nitrite reductase/ring-hydroxylating ferredoxin subunit
MGGKYAICPLHNYRFDPRTGKSIGAICPKVKVFKVIEKDGQAEICF